MKKKVYNSPLGKLILVSDGTYLTGVWYFEQKNYPHSLIKKCEEKPCRALDETAQWLDIYFKGEVPPFTPPMLPAGTEFMKQVWNMLLDIPYGETTTYGELAKKVAFERGVCKMSAQAIGGAVGKNPISIIIPCHRVVGTGGKLTGYAGGIDKKIYLLDIEKGNRK